MTTEDSPVKGLHVFSTGIGSIHREHRYGTRLPQIWWVLFSRKWVEVPVNVFVLEHPEGLILFDWKGTWPQAAFTGPPYHAVARFFGAGVFVFRSPSTRRSRTGRSYLVRLTGPMSRAFRAAQFSGVQQTIRRKHEPATGT